jgi:hypothetical protein
MKLRDLLETWERSAGERRTRQLFSIHLPVHDAAKVAALAQMYPGRSEQDIITDLLSTALDEIEAAFPYVQGSRVIAEDEQGDPIYEDAGLTPRFKELTKENLARLEGESEGDE